MSVDRASPAEIASRLADLSPTKRALLERRLLLARAEGGREAPIPRRLPGQPVPMSFAQQRVWFLDCLEPAAPLYVNVGAMRITGHLNVGALRAAFDRLVNRHEALRTCFVSTDAGPVQIVREHRAFELPIRDVSSEPAHEQLATIDSVIRFELERRFDLSQDALLRARLVRLATDEHVLVLAKHHLADDAWSAGVLAREVRELYAAGAEGRSPALPELEIQYADFACWQRARLDDARLADQIAFWKRQLADLPGLELPTDYVRPEIQSFRGADASIDIPRQLLDDLERLGRESGATLFMSVLSVFKTLLMRYSGQQDAVVGSPMSGRSRPETEGLIGLFLNPVALRTSLEGDPTFRQLLGRVRSVVLDAFAHQDVPFERVVDELRVPRDVSRAPVFQVFFILQNAPRPPLELAGLSVQDIPQRKRVAQYDLTLTTTVLATGLRVQVQYAADLFEPSSMRRLLGHFRTMCEAAVTQPDTPLSQLPLLDDAERWQHVYGWNQTRVEFEPATIHGAFEAQVERTPRASAIIGATGESVSYAELNRRANQVAHALLALGVRREEPVGVCLERDSALPVALLGVLKAGAAYVPLDPASPPERLTFMLRDCGARVLLTQRRVGQRLPVVPDIDQVSVDELAETATGDANPAISVQPDDLAYVIYTSGSTGHPRGVLGPHAGAINRFQWMWDAYPFDPDDVACARTSIGFVDSIWELFGPLLRGVPTALVPEAVGADPRRLVDWLAEHRVTRLVLVPSLLGAVLDTHPDLGRRLPRLRLWTSSGEALPHALAVRFRQLLPEACLLNVYGTSEVAADATCFEVASSALEIRTRVPIGRPIANVRVYVLDRHLQPLPAGVVGELCVAGAGLARGYLGRPDLTAERFVESPFSSERLYRTGDLGRFRNDGTLELLGRADSQVKVRGVRIELSEIEASLERHASVQHAAVVLREDRPGDQRLVAYVVPTRPADVDTGALREHLARWLPSTSVPAQFVMLDTLPRLPNGKLDRARLVATPAVFASAGAEVGEPPATDTERTLADIWRDVLGVASVSRSDNFFELGGHSLLAVRLFTAIEHRFGRTLPLVLLFQAPTLVGLARAIERDDPARHWRTLVPIQRDGWRPAMFWVHRFGGGILGYADLARHLGRDQPFYALQPRGLNGGDVPLRSVEALASEYLSAVRSVQPHGPYHLGGHCFGGIVAFEMACQLRAVGEEVRLLALIEAYAPTSFTTTRWRPSSLAHAARNVAPWFTLYGRHTLRLAPGQIVRRLARLRRLSTGHVELRDVSAHAEDLPPRYLNLMRIHLQAAVRYRPPRGYDGRVTVIRCAALPIGRGHVPDLGWGSATTGGVDVFRVPGEHDTLLAEPHVGTVADVLRAAWVG